MSVPRLRALVIPLLILPVLHAAVGHMVMYKGLQYRIRSKVQELKTRLADEHLVVLEFSTNDPELKKLQWIRDDEFRYQRRMYDIVRVETDEDRVRYFCIHDKDEEELLEGLSRSAGYRTKHRDSGIVRDSRFHFHFPVHEYVFHRFSCILFPDHFHVPTGTTTSVYVDNHPSPPSPPPRV